MISSDIRTMRIQLIRIRNEQGGVINLSRPESQIIVDNLEYFEAMAEYMERNAPPLPQPEPVTPEAADGSNVIQIFGNKRISTGDAA